VREPKDRPEDIEHGSVGVTGDGEWDPSVNLGGRVIWENLEGNSPRHMDGVSDEKVVELWNLLADGNLEPIEQEPWIPEY